ncbi:MAG TPA: hypothetical protein VKD22_01505, partial [Ramlibacter sp.]|nr:hypothetical protein [Ramlibacter sp.]
MRLDGHPGAVHLLLVGGEHGAQAFDFFAHALHQIVHRIDLHVAAFVLLHGEADGQPLRQLEQRRAVGILVFGIGRQGSHGGAEHAAQVGLAFGCILHRLRRGAGFSGIGKARQQSHHRL